MEHACSFAYIIDEILLVPVHGTPLGGHPFDYYRLILGHITHVEYFLAEGTVVNYFNSVFA